MNTYVRVDAYSPSGNPAPLLTIEGDWQTICDVVPAIMARYNWVLNATPFIHPTGPESGQTWEYKFGTTEQHLSGWTGEFHITAFTRPRYL